MYEGELAINPRDFFLDADRLLANQALTAFGSLNKRERSEQSGRATEKSERKG